MSDFNSQINDLIEYQKLIVKLEEALKSKEEENQKIIKFNSDLKDLNNEIKIELNNQSQKIIQLYSEIKNIKKNYENQINTLNITHENEKKKYNEKIMELSAYNPVNQEVKIKNDLESKYKIIIKNKDLEISNLKEEINELKENLALKEKELSILKINFNEQLYTERETHSSQIKNLITKLSNQINLGKADKEKEILKEISLNTKHNDEKTEMLHNELNKIREEKTKNEIKYNKELFDLDTKLKKEIDMNEILNNDINYFQESFEKIKISLSDKDFEINKFEEENKKLYQNNESLMINIKEKEKLIQEQIKGLNELKKNYKLTLNDQKLQIEENKNLKIKIAELEDKINQEQKEEKNENGNVLLHSSDNIILYKDAYQETREKYRRLLQEQKIKNSEIEAKNEEIKSLNNYLQKIKNGLNGNYRNGDLVKKHRELNQKKNYYKQKCINANKYIMTIYNMLTNEQKQNLENKGFIFSKFNDNNSESSKEN